MTNKEKYKKTFNVLNSSKFISLEVEQVKKRRNKNYGMRNVAAAAAVCLAIAGTGAGVYAAARYFGIFDFVHENSQQIPQEAVSQIQTDIEAYQEKNDSIFDCVVREALCDSQTISVVYEVSAKEANKYLFVPIDALPEDDMSSWVPGSEGILQEYASEKGLQIVNIGGGITNRDELGIAVETLDFRSVDDDTIDIYVTCGITEPAKSKHVEITVTGNMLGEGSVMRVKSEFGLQDKSETALTTYDIEMKQDELPYVIERAEIIQTDLGSYADIYFVCDEHTNAWDISFRILDEDKSEYMFFDNSGILCMDDGLYKGHYVLDKNETPESLIIQGYNVMDETIYGETVIRK